MAGRYRIAERIGSGGAGEVYRAIDEQSQTTVAIKLLRPGAARDLEQASRLFEGAWTASLIRHEHIVLVYETGLCDLGPFIVMEDLRGEHAGRLLERHGRLKPSYALALLEPVLLALGVSHGIGLIHGDVKPENVLVCLRGSLHMTVKLLDFGGAGANHDARSLYGTVEYLSPEQASGGAVDYRTDLFSACVLLYELLTNARPFHGSTSTSTVYRIINSPCPSLWDCGLLHQNALWSVIRRGLEKNPNDRYQSARELLDALKRVIPTDVPIGNLLAELLPPAAVMRADLNSNPVVSGIRIRPTLPSIAAPESSPRAIRSSLRPQVTNSDPPSREFAEPPPSQRRDSIGPVLPARYRGRQKVRGIVFQAVDDYLRARRPPRLREQLLLDLPAQEASDLLEGTLQGIIYCDLDTITQYVEMATGRLFDGNASWCRAAGRESVDGVLSGALTRSIPPTPSAVVTLKRVCRVCSPLFDFGEWHATPGNSVRHATVTLQGIEPMCLGLRLFCVGLIERALSVVHNGTCVTIARGEGSFMPRLVVDVITT